MLLLLQKLNGVPQLFKCKHHCSSVTKSWVTQQIFSSRKEIIESQQQCTVTEYPLTHRTWGQTKMCTIYSAYNFRIHKTVPDTATCGLPLLWSWLENAAVAILQYCTDTAIYIVHNRPFPNTKTILDNSCRACTTFDYQNTSTWPSNANSGCNVCVVSCWKQTQENLLTFNRSAKCRNITWGTQKKS